MHANQIDPNRQNAEIEYDPDGADEIKQKNSLIARASSGPEDKPDRQEIIRGSGEHERKCAADEIVLLQPIEKEGKNRPFEQRADTADRKVFLGGFHDVGLQGVAQGFGQGLARVFQEPWPLRKAVFPSR